ncbi:hypothetical protein BGZ60DRAFT_181186 [Tricladium varicosporioides]|nr:hypothetical protein BGZ60DRAFT_181186 [Hymenoscyphus varicosporioides]
MVRRKSVSAEHRDKLIDQASLDVKSKTNKATYEAEKILGLPKSSVTRPVNEGKSRSEARQIQQKLLAALEKVLLKWIKDLKIIGYSPGRCC